MHELDLVHLTRSPSPSRRRTQLLSSKRLMISAQRMHPWERNRTMIYKLWKMSMQSTMMISSM